MKESGYKGGESWDLVDAKAQAERRLAAARDQQEGRIGRAEAPKMDVIEEGRVAIEGITQAKTLIEAENFVRQFNAAHTFDSSTVPQEGGQVMAMGKGDIQTAYCTLEGKEYLVVFQADVEQGGKITLTKTGKFYLNLEEKVLLLPMIGFGLAMGMLGFMVLSSAPASSVVQSNSVPVPFAAEIQDKLKANTASADIWYDVVNAWCDFAHDQVMKFADHNQYSSGGTATPQYDVVFYTCLEGGFYR